jgi:hypothetical protein
LLGSIQTNGVAVTGGSDDASFVPAPVLAPSPTTANFLTAPGDDIVEITVGKIPIDFSGLARRLFRCGADGLTQPLLQNGAVEVGTVLGSVGCS